MENANMPFIVSIERFKPHTYQLEQGEGFFMSHSHGYDELTLVLEGEGYYSSPQQNIKVAAGDMIVIPPGLHHGFVCTTPWQGISVHYRMDILPVQSRYPFHRSDQEGERIHHAHLTQDDLQWANFSLARLEKECLSDDRDMDGLHLKQLALETVLQLFRRNLVREQSSEAGRSEQRVIQDILKEIHMKYFTSLTVGDLAAKHFMSESHLRKKFVEAVGVSPKQYIINLRIKEAKRLLRQSSKAIETIAAEVGFTSSSRFYDSFVKSVGATPLEWRTNQQ
ncbi:MULTISPECIES: AraC family transcriptional regulator [Paenibacillus]|uniref:AraC family transcriptional regulator n=1 Tax=Paenibacillus TaxID=44249 RepID=UPI001F381DA2|nr:AraC family transcriptional regulator [Paenibacillus sp. JJ-223]CAH1210117.1 Melibiose operon regulatory protein [Paenibacillus sp. JJ-223]